MWHRRISVWDVALAPGWWLLFCGVALAYLAALGLREAWRRATGAS